MVVFYIYKIHFLCGFPCGRYYIGKHKHTGNLDNDRYTGSGNFCKSYFTKYGKINGTTYIKEILEINPSEQINSERENILIGNSYIVDNLCMNIVSGGIMNEHSFTNHNNKSVVQYDFNCNFVKKYSSQLEASNAMGHKYSSTISKCCITQSGSAAGYIWRFEDAPCPIVSEVIIRSVPIIQYNLKGEQLRLFDSILQASTITQIYEDSISKCCLRLRKSAGKFIWRKYNDPLKLSEIKKDTYIGKRSVLQYDLKGNYIETFNSLKEAADSLGMKWQTIQRVCSGKRRTSGGFIWKYGEN